jgi:hypothetical protein
MKPSRLMLAAAVAAALHGVAQAQSASQPAQTSAEPTAPAPPPTQGADARYVQRIGERFESFAGSSENFESLAIGLRRGSEVTLTGSGESVTFTPPTRPMGYGNVTRALDLASRQLAAAGITEPTPQEIQAALMGGTVTGPQGQVTLQGVLQLRSEGMGWGQIAHTIGVHPGLGAGKTAPAPAASVRSAGGSGITTALGTNPARPVARGHRGEAFVHGQESRAAIATASGSSAAATGAAGASKARDAGHGRGGGRM